MLYIFSKFTDKAKKIVDCFEEGKGCRDLEKSITVS